MAKLERLIALAEDELVQYSTTARKIEKMRQKIGLSLNKREQEQAKAELLAEMRTDELSQREFGLSRKLEIRIKV